MAELVFDPSNEIVKLCAAGMEAEGAGQPEKAKEFFTQAWAQGSNPFEKFTAAHFLARHQRDTETKMYWDQISLQQALLVGDDSMLPALPSLYLNIGKCHEDLGDLRAARENYERAYSNIAYLKTDGYGQMIASGVIAALHRTSQVKTSGE